jgi:P-type Cu+ transporter
MEQKVLLKVEGMDCANCAQTITRTLSKEGLKDVSVDFISGEVTFDEVKSENISEAVNSINRLGYRVKSRSDEKVLDEADHADHTHLSGTQWKFYVSLLFTIPLVLHMLLPFAFLHNPYVQLALAIPVMAIGVTHFGRSAYYSLRAGAPNMDVLIFIGSTAAFFYSLSGMYLYSGTPHLSNYIFFETGASIITLVLLGNLIEQRSVKQTTSSIAQLSRLQPQFAKKIVSVAGRDEFTEVPVSEIVAGDMVSVNTGDRIPADGIIISGQLVVDESMLTGESLPLTKLPDENITGGTFVHDGNAVFRVKHSGKEMALSQIIELVKKAQHSKPQIQKLGDRISVIFVPVVLLISVVTFLVSYFVVRMAVSSALMHSIAVLVISCPCAMGLATPTAVMVGLGRAARNGILIKGGSTIEQLASVKTIVFDKTGTLTTGNFRIRNVRRFDASESEVFSLMYSLEKNSSHPLARAITSELKSYSSSGYKWKNLSEDKGIGINATDEKGDLYSIGSYKMVLPVYDDHSHDLYLLKNNRLLAYIDLEDEIKPGVPQVISKLKQSGYKIVMLSGDRKMKCEYVAQACGIDEYYFEKLPSEKLQILEKLAKENPIAMVGDGINDAPALSKADVGISLSNATDIAIQSAQVVLLSHNDFEILLKAFRIGLLTFKTIKQNLFWAFFYNVIAIPVAAVGLLSPTIAAFSMAFSDVIVIGNSLRLRTKKITD